MEKWSAWAIKGIRTHDNTELTSSRHASFYIFDQRKNANAERKESEENWGAILEEKDQGELWYFEKRPG